MTEAVISGAAGRRIGGINWSYPWQSARADFLAGLTGHHLYAALNEALYSSLMVENRRRLVHMDRALDRLDADMAQLRLAYNRQRQEEIIEEIEVILLSADLLVGEEIRLSY